MHIPLLCFVFISFVFLFPCVEFVIYALGIFSVMRRYRTRVRVSESVTLRTELTDVTLVSEDTY